MRSFEEKVKTGGKDRGPMTPEEQAKALAELKFEIIKVAVLDEKENFNKAKFEALPPKEKGLCLKAMARYGQLPQWSKVLISASAATGMTLAFSSGVGFAMIGGVFAWKAVRAGAGTAAGLLAGKGYNWAFDKIVDVKNIKNKGQQEIIAEIEKNLIGGGSKEGSAEKKEEEFEKWFSRTAASTNQKLDSLAKKEKRILLGKAIGQGVVIAGVAGLTSMGMEKGMAGLNPDLASKMGIKIAPSAENGPKAGMAAAVETPAEAAKETQILKIGVRGPEGAIIDNFKAKPELAKAFGWDGKTLINEWAGTKAHQLWLKSVEEELSRPEMVEKLKAQGFTADAEGYAKAMHRIGKGSVEIAPTGEVRLADDTSFLKETVQPDRPSIVLGQEGVPAAPETPGAQKLPEPGAQEMPPKPKVDPLLSPENLKIKEAVTRLIEPEILTDKTFKAAAGVKLGKILEAVPPEIYADKYALSRYWQGLSEVGVKTPDLPGSSWLGLTYDDFRKYSEMAKFLRENPALKGVAGLENMTVEEFLKNYGGDLGKGIKNQAGSNLSEVIGAASPAKGTVNLPEPTSGARIDLPEPTEIKKPGE